MKRYKSIQEEILIPLEIGSEFLYGKWKNKKGLVKSFTKNDKGEIQIIDKSGKMIPLLKIRLIKN